MESTTATFGAIVIYGNDDDFVRFAMDAVPADTDCAVLLLEDVPAAEFEYDGIVPLRLDDRSGDELASGRYYRAAVDRVEALIGPFGDRVVAVLQGVRSAGDLAVAHAVKRGGGAVIAVGSSDGKANGTTSAFVDAFLPARDVPSALTEMIADPFAGGSAEDDEQLRTFLRLVRQRTGIDFAQYKMATIRRRLQRLMVVAKVTTLGDFSRHLQQHPAEYQRLVHEFLIKVTDFFRDDQLFEYLRSEILPELIARSRAEKLELRVWSAGCATGEEAYSLAILISELYGDDLRNAGVKIFATDLDDTAIAFARQGIYPRSALGAMPPEWIERYFTSTPRGFEVKKSIRNITIFGQHDLGQRAPFPRTDLVLCRNVLIYFTKELQQRTLQLFAFSLREGGYLVLGKSETMSPTPEFFAAVHTPYRTFRRYGERVLIPPPRTREAYPMMRDRSDVEARPAEAKARGTAEGTRPGLFDRLGVSLFTGSTGYVVVDRRYDVVAINAEARRLLGIFGLGVGEDLIHLVQGTASTEIRVAVDLGLKGVEHARDIDMGDAPLSARHQIRITVHPERSAEGILSSGGVIVRVEDVSESVRQRDDADRVSSEREAEISRLNVQQQKLAGVRDAFAIANQELSTANVELRSMNEHLLISAEEAEASTEEIETLNEEMQATNEELETLNEELQATIEELNTTNDELHVRGLELQGAIEERDRAIAESSGGNTEFAAIFSELPVPIVHFRPSGSADRMNDAYLALLATHGDPLPLRSTRPGQAESPFARAAHGEAFDEVWRLGDASPVRYLVRSKRLATDGRGTVLTLLELGD